jgi:phage/plasmid-like protein (TIGR03299 family)
MAHEIDLSTGRPAIAYVGETPWHGLGEKLPVHAPIDTWLHAARLAWELKRLPVQYLVDGRVRTMHDRFVLVRSDTGAALSVVSGDYQIVQPREVLEFYRELVTLYGYTLETSGALDGGRKVWALARTGITDAADNGGKDELAAYLLLATSCDKTLATTAAFTSIRVVCQNTLFFAMEDIVTERRPQVKVPHNLRFNAACMKQELGVMDKAWSGFIAKVRRMASYEITPDVASSFFDDLLLQKNRKTLSGKAQREREAIIALFQSAPGQDLSSAKETLWGAVNAITYYADHVRSGAAGDRLDSAWFGAGYALKEKAWAIRQDCCRTDGKLEQSMVLLDEKSSDVRLYSGPFSTGAMLSRRNTAMAISIRNGITTATKMTNLSGGWLSPRGISS